MVIDTLGFYLFVLIIVLAAAFAVFVVVYTAYWLARSWAAPTTRVHAKVVRGNTKPWDVSLTGETTEMQMARLGMLGRWRSQAAHAYRRLAGIQEVPEITLVEGTDYYVTFAFNNRTMEFNVPEDSYVACVEGVEGLLVFKC